MKKFKILTKNMTPPFQNGTPYEIGKQYTCENFDTSNKECSMGYYATDIDGLIYTNLSNNKRVFEVNVSGKEKIFDSYKQRFEKMEFIREIPLPELKTLINIQSDCMDWDYYSALFPFNPFSIVPSIKKEKALILLNEWASVRASVRDSVRDSVGDSVGDFGWDSVWASIGASVWASVRASVWDSVWDYVWDSVGDSVRDSVRAYYGYLFPGITDWKYIKHDVNIYPFRPGVDLWLNGLIPVYYNNTWNLYSKDGKWA